MGRNGISGDSVGPPYRISGVRLCPVSLKILANRIPIGADEIRHFPGDRIDWKRGAEGVRRI